MEGSVEPDTSLALRNLLQKIRPPVLLTSLAPFEWIHATPERIMEYSQMASQTTATLPIATPYEGAKAHSHASHVPAASPPSQSPSRFEYSPNGISHRFLQYAADSSYFQPDQDPQNLENSLFTPIKSGAPRQLFQTLAFSPGTPSIMKSPPAAATSSTPTTPATKKSASKKRTRHEPTATPGLTSAMDEVSMEPTSPLKKKAPLNLDSSTIDLTETSLNESMNISITAQSDKSIELTLGASKPLALESLFEEERQKAGDLNLSDMPCTLLVSQTQPYFGQANVSVEELLANWPVRLTPKHVVATFAIILSPDGTCTFENLSQFLLANPALRASFPSIIEARRAARDLTRTSLYVTVPDDHKSFRLSPKNPLLGFTNIVPAIWFKFTGRNEANIPPDFPLSSSALPPSYHHKHSLPESALCNDPVQMLGTPEIPPTPENSFPLPSSSIAPTMPLPDTLPLGLGATQMHLDSSPTQPLSMFQDSQPDEQSAFSTQKVSKLASQARYDDGQFLAQLGSRFMGGKTTSNTNKSSKPSLLSQAPHSPLQSSSAQNTQDSQPLSGVVDPSDAKTQQIPSHSQLLSLTSSTLKNVLSSDVSSSVLDSLMRSKPRKGFYDKVAEPSLTRTSSAYSRFYGATQRAEIMDSQLESNGAGLMDSDHSPLPSQLVKHVSHGRDEFDRFQLSTHYSLVSGAEDDEPKGVLEYDPDFVPYVSNSSATAEIPSSRSRFLESMDEGVYEPEERVMDVDFDFFGLNSQLPANDQKKNDMVLWKDIEDADDMTGTSRPEDIDEIVSSQESVVQSQASRASNTNHRADLSQNSMSSQWPPTADAISATPNSRHRFMAPSTTQTPSPVAFTSSQEVQGRGSQRMGLQPYHSPAAKVSASKKKKVPRSRSIYAPSDTNYPNPSQSTDEIDDDSEQNNVSILDTSIVDHEGSRFEAIEEFTSEERKQLATSASTEYSPYQLVASAHLKNSTTLPMPPSVTHSNTTPNVSYLPPIRQASSTTSLANPRAFLSPNASKPVPLGSTLHSPAATHAPKNLVPVGSVSWLQTHAPPEMQGNSLEICRTSPEVGQLPMMLKIVLLGDTIAGSSFTTALCYVIPTDPKQGNANQAGVIDLTEPSAKPSLAIAFLHFDAHSDLELFKVGSLVSATAHLTYSYQNEKSAIWPFHKKSLAPTSETPSNALANILAPLIVVDRHSIIVKDSQEALMGRRFAPLEQFTNVVPVKMSSENSVATHRPGQRPFVMPNALNTIERPIGAAQGLSVPGFTRARPSPAIQHYQSPLGFVGGPTTENIQILVLGIFASPFAPSHRLSQMQETKATIRDFSKNYSKTVADLEVAAKQKRDLFFKRSNKIGFQLHSILSTRPMTPGTMRKRILAFVKSTKSLMWVDVDGADDIQPGQTFTLLNARLMASRSYSSTPLRTMIENCVSFFGIGLEGCIKSLSPTRLRAVVSRANTLSAHETYFPSSQDSAMDVDEPEASPASTENVVSKRQDWLTLNSSTIPLVHFVKKLGSTTAVSSRDLKDCMHVLQPSLTDFSTKRRVAVLCLVTSPLKPVAYEPYSIEGRSKKSYFMASGRIVIYGFGNQSFDIILPIHLLRRYALQSPILFDGLLQRDLNTFEVDGFTQSTMLIEKPILSTSRPLLRNFVPWGIVTYETGSDETIQYKKGNGQVREKFSEVQKVLFSAAGVSSQTMAAANIGIYSQEDVLPQPRYVCPHKHRDIVLLPSTWNSSLFEACELPDRLCYCRSCFSLQTPVPI